MKSDLKLVLALCIFFVFSCNNNSQQESLVQFNIDVDGPILPSKMKPMTLLETNGTKENSMQARIKRRGGYSISFPKHSYEIDLKEDEILANLPEDDDWILNANFIDKTFLRHVISYELFARMNPNNVASRCKYVELSLNSEYNGLYVLMEKLDKSSLNIKAKDSTSVIFKEPHFFRKSYDGIQPQRAHNFHQQTFPKIGNRDQSSLLEGIREFILTSSDANFKTGISALFDINNIIDWHLLLLISNNSDGILKNFYLYKIDANTPIRIAPWDYDHSFGRDGDNEMNLDKNPLKIERSILFARLLKFDWYKSKLKKRWKELNAENILSEDGLMKSILVKSQVVRDRALRNFEKWPVNSPIYYDDNNFDKEIEVMLTFVEIRHKRLRAYFKSI